MTDRSDIIDSLTRELKDLKADNLLRSLKQLSRKDAVHATLDGREVVLFCSNDYLGLSMDARLIEAVREGAAKYGAGSGASRLINGSLDVHGDAEAALARWKQTDASILFGSGYLANLGLLGALAGVGDAVLCDRLNHASLIDGARLSGARLLAYRHNDPDHLESLLAKRHARYRRVVIATDSVFSMDGDVAPLPDLLDLAEKFDALLVIDEAHAVGILGASGRGAVEHFELPGSHPLLVQMGTLSKAAGLYGAYVAGTQTIIDSLINKSRSLIYSTAPPPAIAHAVSTAIELITSAESARRDLITSTRRVCESLIEQGWDVRRSGTPIIPVVIGGAAETLEASEALLSRGILAPAIRPPSVPRGGSRIRLTLSSAHSDRDIETLVKTFSELAGSRGRPPDKTGTAAIHSSADR